MPHYALQPRRHQHEGRVAVQEGPDGPRPPSDFAVDAPDPVVRPDLASVLRREFRVGQRLGEPVVHRPLVALCPDELGRRFVELRVERLLVDRYDVRRHGPRSLCRWICCLVAGNHMTGRTPCSAMRLAICERNFVSPLCSKQFDHQITVWRKIIDCCTLLKF